MGAEVTVDAVVGEAGVKRLAGDWQALAARYRQPGVFQSFGMIELAAAAAAGAGHVPAVVRIHRNGALYAILPVKVVRTLGSTIVQPMTAPLSQYCDGVGGALDSDELRAVAALARERFGADLILFRKVRADSGLAAAIDALGQTQGEAATAPYIDLAAFADFKSYEASFSKATRRSRRQRLGRLTAQGVNVWFRVLQGGGREYVARAIEWKKRWLADRGLKSPVFDDGAWQAALIASAALPDAVVSVLFADARPVAIELGYRSGATYVSYLGAYDPEYAEYSVGQQQILRTIEWCFANAIARFDMLAPNDDYKRQWTRGDAGVAVQDHGIALTALGRAIAETRRRTRPLARRLLLGLNPGVRAMGARLAKPAVVASATMGLAALLAVAQE